MCADSSQCLDMLIVFLQHVPTTQPTPQPAHMFWKKASDRIWLLCLFFGKYLPACRAGLLSLSNRREEEARTTIRRGAFLVLIQNMTLDLGNVVVLKNLY